MGTCETCVWWNSDGVKSYGTRRDAGNGQLWARPCQRFPKFEPRWFDDWCGEHKHKDQTNA